MSAAGDGRQLNPGPIPGRHLNEKKSALKWSTLAGNQKNAERRCHAESRGRRCWDRERGVKGREVAGRGRHLGGWQR